MRLYFALALAALLSIPVGVADENRPSEPKKVRTDWAEIQLSGSYPESQQMPGLFGELSESLPVCLDRLRQAAKDKAIKGVLLRLDGVQVGWAKLHELQIAIESIRSAGKPVWAFTTDASTKDYLLACSCDRILIPESATLMLTGLRAEVTFYRNLFDMLDIKAEMLRVGAYKSAAEPYTRTEMSPEFRAEMEEILNDYHTLTIQHIAKRRSLTEEKASEIIDEGLISAARAKELGLIDELAYTDQLESLIQGGDASLDLRMRKDYRKKKPDTELTLFSLMEVLSGGEQQAANTAPRIVVLNAEGMIVTGNAPTGLLGEASISSDRFVPLIEKIGKDPNVKAIVLRVDSPGGSALASDLIWRALEATGKPVVASMGDTAASGGYYISMGADRIYAEPGTLTGSIGVVGGKVSFEGLMKKVGVTTSVIRRGRNSGVLSITEGFSDSEREAMQNMLNTIYTQFTQKAATGRKMEYDKLEALARGRVYTGHRAKELGLIDEIGTLADAVAYARKLSDDPDSKLEIETLPKPSSPLEMLLGGERPATDPLASLSKQLPEALVPAIRHWSAIEQLAKEPGLTILPYAVTIE
ncbi:MAG: signal peptide peptidase SppA [Planctomyces sp.]|nr:signal peptide peptidase SppA [Planctomyces sp.]